MRNPHHLRKIRILVKARAPTLLEGSLVQYPTIIQLLLDYMERRISVNCGPRRKGEDNQVKLACLGSLYSKKNVQATG